VQKPDAVRTTLGVVGGAAIVLVAVAVIALSGDDFQPFGGR
jgi:hypothetical protein